MRLIWTIPILTVLAMTAVCPAARAQLGTLDPNSLACTRNSFAQGFGVLPNCSQISSSVADDIVFHGSANCVLCGEATLIAFTLEQQFGLSGNGPCNTPVPWSLKGALFTTPPYLGGTFTATSTLAIARITASVDCNGSGVPTYSGPNGAKLSC